MQTGDTIIACATAAGNSLRAIVRVSGPRAFDVLRELGSALRGSTSPADAPHGRNGHLETRRGVRPGRITLDGGLSFPCMVATFPGPGSYTGEDVVEFFVPGNPHLIERVMRVAMQKVEGVRFAAPGEFTARAYLNERLTLEQAEGVAMLIAAQGLDELREAQRLVSGEQGDRYRALADETMTLLALVEAGIDFTDQEDVVAIAPDRLLERAEKLVATITSMVGKQRGSEAESGLPRVALAGRPNAGKSTLFNALLGRARAVVSDIAGTTRDVLQEELDLSREIAGGGSVLLCDTPGVGEVVANSGATDERSQAASEDFVRGADVVVWCDPAGRFDAAEARPTGAPVIRVRTKADLPHEKDEGEVLEVSAWDGYHLPVLRRAIADAVWSGRLRGAVLPRHQRALSTARDALVRAISLVRAEGLREPELVAGALREALDALGELTGRMTADDVIGRVFATFCVGK
ncbi:MAG: 50S ribosome-binding GTPase [Planctomycetes bacterium]|nr:50S ribosome-binding GTPase [Planctomycetota bacterium]